MISQISLSDPSAHCWTAARPCAAAGEKWSATGKVSKHCQITQNSNCASSVLVNMRSPRCSSYAYWLQLNPGALRMFNPPAGIVFFRELWLESLRLSLTLLTCIWSLYHILTVISMFQIYNTNNEFFLAAALHKCPLAITCRVLQLQLMTYNYR